MEPRDTRPLYRRVRGFFIDKEQVVQKAYKHQGFEEKIYRLWETSGGFTPPSGSEAKKRNLKPFSIIMPPPNANDPLHVGHAMFIATQDILIRYHRMLGEAALWLPGTDHAGIETQYVFEKKLKKQGKSRFSFDRKTLFDMIWTYVQENSEVAISQMKKLGASADWSRLKFTLEEDCVDLVLTTFEQMHEQGLIERQVALVNFSPQAGTSYSNLEVVYQDRTSPLYYVRYPLKSDPDQYVVVATTRPEPIFSDTHLAVHPKDPSKKALIGTIVLNPLTQAEMEIIGDEFVDPEFGTGVVKLTPAHDFADFEVAKRHNLPMYQAINMEGRITELGGEYAGMKVQAAREKVVTDLQGKGLIEKIDTNYTNRVATCYKTGGDIEPLPLSQFFVKVQPLATKALTALESKETVVYGSGHDKILRQWLENLEDWNISRQIVWGIRMPVWYEILTEKAKLVTQNGEIVIGFLDATNTFVKGAVSDLLSSYSFDDIEAGLQTLTAPIDARYVVSRQKPGPGYLQETDTFDTWFSSSQWPVVTLKTSKPGDFGYYYPTNVMETAYDILVFWVMRMMMMGMYVTDETPFKQVYLHGLVRDEKGQKMSKSKGNVVNPIDLVDKYGADALRMALVMSTTPGHDSAVGESKVKGMRNMANKIWNAARYVKMMNDDAKEQENTTPNSAFTRKLADTIVMVTQHLNELKVGQAAELAHNEFWHWYCDECIEAHKRGDLSPAELTQGLEVFLRLLHPFMPFVTEAVWQELYPNRDLLLLALWPSITN